MKQILLLTAPFPLFTVNLPSLTVTVCIPSIQRFELVGVPVMMRTPSALIAKVLSVKSASPATMRTVYVPFGTAISQRNSALFHVGQRVVSLVWRDGVVVVARVDAVVGVPAVGQPVAPQAIFRPRVGLIKVRHIRTAGLEVDPRGLERRSAAGERHVAVQSFSVDRILRRNLLDARGCADLIDEQSVLRHEGDHHGLGADECVEIRDDRQIDLVGAGGERHAAIQPRVIATGFAAAADEIRIRRRLAHRSGSREDESAVVRRLSVSKHQPTRKA